MAESFRGTNKQASSASEDFEFDVKKNTAEREPFDFEIGRRTAEGSPSAIIAGIVIHANRAMVKDINPNAFKQMDPVVASALQCDLTGYEAEVKASMIEAGLTEAEVEDLWSVSAQAARQARKRQTDKSFKLSPEDANRRAFDAAQADLIGFMEYADPSENEGESFR